MDEKRIKEAQTNVKNYLEEGLLRKDKFKSIVYKTFLNNAKESLMISNYIKDKSNLWTIVASYYSMYYMANAVLYKLGYKVGDRISHKVTSDSLIVFTRNKLTKYLIDDFEDEKNKALAIIKTDDILQSFDNERIKRSHIQYKTTRKNIHSKSKTSLKRAKTFLFEMEKLLIPETALLSEKSLAKEWDKED